MNYLRSLFVIFAIALLAAPSAVFAQARISLNLKPSVIEQKIDPGQSISFAIAVTNEGQGKLELTPQMRDIATVDAAGRPIYSNDRPEPGETIATWTTFTERELVLAPGETKQLHVSIAVPADARPGGHFGTVFVTQRTNEEKFTGSAVGIEQGANVMLQIAGEIIEDTQVRSFEIDRFIYDSGNVRFMVKIENLGNVLTRPRGLVEITNMFGKKVATVPVNKDANGVFPKTTRAYEAQWESEGFAFGRYEAMLALSIESTQGVRSSSRTVTFWVLPSKPLLAILGTLLVIFVVIWAIIRSYVRRQLAGYMRGKAPRNERASGLSLLSSIVIALLVILIVGLLGLFLFFG
ncbi:MAG TPA: hypothetical protein VLB83_03655 [Candidatus Paceibacterota bacterium]|nr:hypothetical protein [Candidatus Paceibacterota bacterium]